MHDLLRQTSYNSMRSCQVPLLSETTEGTGSPKPDSWRLEDDDNLQLYSLNEHIKMLSVGIKSKSSGEENSHLSCRTGSVSVASFSRNCTTQYANCNRNTSDHNKRILFYLHFSFPLAITSNSHREGILEHASSKMLLMHHRIYMSSLRVTIGHSHSEWQDNSIPSIQWDVCLHGFPSTDGCDVVRDSNSWSRKHSVNIVL